MKIYEYMVTYNADGANGRCCISRRSKIKSYEDIQEIDLTVDKLNDYKLNNPTVNNFILLRTYRGNFNNIK